MCNFSKYFDKNNHQQCCVVDGQKFKLFTFKSIFSEKTKQLTIKEVLSKIQSTNTYSVITIYVGKGVFSCEEISLLIDALSNQNNIKTLNLILHVIDLSVECAYSFSKLFKSLKDNIEQLELCLSVSSYSYEMIKIITKDIFNMTHLQELNLQFKINCVASINFDLFKLPQLKKLASLKLDLWDCKITDEMAIVLGQQLCKLKQLKILELNLKFNEIGDKGCRQLLDGLKELDKLKLNLSYNDISDRGVKYIKDYITFILQKKKVKTVMEINVQNNNISQDGTKALIKAENLLTKFQFDHFSEDTFRNNKKFDKFILHIKEFHNVEDKDNLTISHIVFSMKENPKSGHPIYQIFSTEQKLNLENNKINSQISSNSVRTYFKNDYNKYYKYLEKELQNYQEQSKNKKILLVMDCDRFRYPEKVHYNLFEKQLNHITQFEIQFSFPYYFYFLDYLKRFNFLQNLQKLRYLKFEIKNEYLQYHKFSNQMINSIKLFKIKRLVCFHIVNCQKFQ